MLERDIEVYRILAEFLTQSRPALSKLVMQISMDVALSGVIRVVSVITFWQPFESTRS